MIGTFQHNGHTLNALLTPTVITLIDRLWQDEREQIKRTLDDAGADAELRLRTLRDHDRGQGMGRELIRYAYTRKGAVEIIAIALKEAGQTTTVEDLDLDMTGELQRVSLSMLGVDLDELLRLADKDEDKEPDPTQAVRVTG